MIMRFLRWMFQSSITTAQLDTMRREEMEKNGFYEAFRAGHIREAKDLMYKASHKAIRKAIDR